MDEGWSIVEVSRVGGRSRLTSCLAVAPLKILSPKVEADYSTAVLSSYGGGLVAGDCARLRVRCGREAKLFLGTQAFTKVYKTTDGRVARQELAGHVEAGACVVSLPDPVVPYAESAFVQEQVWHLSSGASLVLLDGGTAGRGERGERFHYSSYTSNISIYLENELVLAERLRLQPKRQALGRVGAFGQYTAFANAFIVGDTARSAIEEELRCALAPMLTGQRTRGAGKAALVSLAEPRPGVLALRALGRTNGDLEKVLHALATAVSLPQVLGENPLRRKY
ncbi:MAG: urease accessory protein UreD [Gemmatimonadetes bacterium]|nr:urease accessory protein UreD [Gemmatimonadota bacterium]